MLTPYEEQYIDDYDELHRPRELRKLHRERRQSSESERSMMARERDLMRRLERQRKQELRCA